MSRWYECTVEVTKFDPHKVMEIENAAEEEWEFGDWDFQYAKPGGKAVRMEATKQNSLGGGMSEEEFTDRLASAIMRANGGPCEVRVSAVCLEDLPREVHTRGADDFERLKLYWPPEDE